MYDKHLLMLIDPSAKYGMPISEQNRLWVRHEDTTKTYKFDLEIKSQCRIGIMNVHNTSSHGDRCLCQI